MVGQFKSLSIARANPEMSLVRAAPLRSDLNDFKPPAQPGKTDRFICIREIGVTFNEFLHIIELIPKTLLKNNGTVITNVQDHGRGFGGAPLDFGLPADK